ncbi:MAG TPA: peptide chain release factor-like protein [Pirellulaceae bacterium]|nr:peptide chain release factor-like protein [Pirellulaceae bacterium]
MANDPDVMLHKRGLLLSDDQLLAECQLQATRRGGPGGQHRNKTASAVVIVHVPTGVCGQASERRDQQQNRRVALDRLRINMALAIRERAVDDQGKLVEPLPVWTRYINQRRIAIGLENDHLPPLLGQVLDWLAEAEWQIDTVATHLGVSSSQIVKFLKRVPAAFQTVNRQRQAQGLHTLK